MTQPNKHSDAAREAFERWASRHNSQDLRPVRCPERDNEYFHKNAELAWQAWQAAIAHERKLADEIEAVVSEYLGWRLNNPHIKGGENYLRRMRLAIKAKHQAARGG